jgi:hypothetical protein
MSKLTFDEQMDKLLQRYTDSIVGMLLTRNNPAEFKEAAKAQLRTLFKEMCEEAAPGTHTDITGTKDPEWRGYVQGVSDYKAKLATILEEPK